MRRVRTQHPARGRAAGSSWSSSCAADDAASLDLRTPSGRVLPY